MRRQTEVFLIKRIIDFERRLLKRLDSFETRITALANQLEPAPLLVRPNDLDREGDLDRVITIREAVRISGLAESTLKRTRADKIIRISPGRVGMRKRDALLMKKEG